MEENYAPQEKSGMCHSMPQCHLPEWQEEEEEQTFIHYGSWMPNKGLDNPVLAAVNCIYMMSLKSDGWYLRKFCSWLCYM